MKRFWIVWMLILALSLSGAALADEPALDSDMGSLEIILPDEPEPTATPEPQDLSNLMLGQTYTLPGLAKVKPVSFAYVDSLAQYDEGADLKLKKWISFWGEADERAGGFDDQARAAIHDYAVLLINSASELDPKEWSDTGLSAYLDTAYGEPMRYGPQYSSSNMTPFIPGCSWMESGINSDFACIDFQIVNMKSEPIDLTKSAQVIINYDGTQYKGWIRLVNEDIGQVYRYCVNEPAPHYPYAVVSPSDAAPVATGQVATYVVGATLPNIAIEDKGTLLSITLVIDGNELTYHIR